MILRRYSQKNEKIAPQYKKYLQSCAELIRPENPPKFEFVDSTVELELVQGTKNEEKENELHRKLSDIYFKNELVWVPEHMSNIDIQREFRNFMSMFNENTFEQKFNDTLSITSSVASRYNYNIIAMDTRIAHFIIKPNPNVIALKFYVLDKDIDETLKFAFAYGWGYTHRNLWKYFIRTIKKTLNVKDWKFK